jgi:hypothetical protein
MGQPTHLVRYNNDRTGVTGVSRVYSDVQAASLAETHALRGGNAVVTRLTDGAETLVSTLGLGDMTPLLAQIGA